MALRSNSAHIVDKSNSKKNNTQTAKMVVDDNLEMDGEEEQELDVATIMNSLYKHYPATGIEGSTKAGQRLSGKTLTFLENSLYSGSVSCLICIDSIRHADAIWSCRHCYCPFHLKCIRRWANDSTARLKTAQQLPREGHYNHMGEYIPPQRVRPLHWCCPQCRDEYSVDEKPVHYECFCGKDIDPPQQSWLVPHSCGEMCEKSLKPDCGHKCMLLCHPGPCPPCAQYAHTSCLCGKSPKKTQRCSEQKWQCNKKCNELLACGEHRCSAICHAPGQCPPCVSRSRQLCECGAEDRLRNCFELKWNCKKVCGKSYSCGIHNCSRVCHAGDCGQCPLSLPRSCPCGKTKKVGPCTDVIGTCNDTCEKLLKCGTHTCSQRCHRGKCHMCLAITKKKCRCGLHVKEVPCANEFLCETKCKLWRECNKHPCHRKCCNGNCPPCDKICGKTLACKKHKCQSICHDGPCYPCDRQSKVNCRCGQTSRSVPCGRERSVNIVCQQPCRVPSKCHHAIKHRCHKKECPPCREICGLPNATSGCQHPCFAKCHDVVRQANGEVKRLPHPKCQQIVAVACLGGHELAEWQCCDAKPSSCQRPCNRVLQCGNHKCERVCHAVPDKQDMKQQEGCETCEKGCEFEPPKGCRHPCRRACHVPPCPPCQANIQFKCHCGLSSIVHKCHEFYKSDLKERELLEHQERLLSCGNQCNKTYACGHRCMSECHSGKCPNSQNCSKKVRLYCACKRLKSDMSCDKKRAMNLLILPCDENCQLTTAQLDIVKKLEAFNQKIMVEEERRKQQELKLTTSMQKKKFMWQHIAIYVAILVAILSVIIWAFLSSY